MQQTAHSDFVVPDATLIQFHHRDSRLPCLYKSHSSQHPLNLRPDVLKHVIIYIQDPAKHVMKRLYEFEDTLKIPLGHDHDMGNIGQVEFEPGTLVLCRLRGNTNPALDIPVFFVVNGHGSLDGDLMIKLLAVRDDILGVDALITGNKPSKDPNTRRLTGGTHFERFGPTGVKNARCYSMTQTHQRSKSLVGPVASGKVVEEQLDEYGLLRQSLVNVGTEVGMKILELVLPATELNIIRQNSIANNVPIIGYAGNYAFPASQLNLSTPVSYDQANVGSLSDMGEFGQVEGHRDSGDSPGAWTLMINMSRLPAGYSPGRLHIPILGAYAKLLSGVLIGMCGLMKHGSSPPIAPRGQSVAAHACRVAFINYPPECMISCAGINTIPLGSTTNGKLYTLGPEATTPVQLRTHVNPPTNHANWAFDGHAFMTRERHAEFMGRALLANTIWFARQMPSSYELQIDEDKFLSSFSYRNTNGDRISLQSPGLSQGQTQLNFLRHLNQRAMIIPFCHDRRTRYEDMKRALVAAENGEPSQDQAYRRSGLKRKDPQPMADTQGHSQKERRRKGDRLDLHRDVHHDSYRVFDYEIPHGPPHTRAVTQQIMTNLQNQAKGLRSVSQRQEECYDDIVQQLVNTELEDTTYEDADMQVHHPDALSTFALDIPLMLQHVPSDNEVVPEPGSSNAVNPHVTVAKKQSVIIARILHHLDFSSVVRTLVDFEKKAQTPQLSVDRALFECEVVLNGLQQQPSHHEAASALPLLWQHLHDLLQATHHSMAYMRLLRAKIVNTSLSVHQWLCQIIQHAMDYEHRTSTPGVSTWVYSLVDHIDSLLNNPQFCGQAIPIYSRDYLPKITDQCYTLNVPKQMSYSKDHVALHTTRITRTWLGFPSDLPSLAVIAIIESLCALQPRSVLLLDELWELYSQPERLSVGTRSYQRQSWNYYHQLVQEFVHQLGQHAFGVNDSQESQSLVRLQQAATALENRVHRTSTIGTLSSTSTSSISYAANTPPSTLSAEPLVSFLRRLFPILDQPFGVHANSSDRLFKAISLKPDYYLPFRQLAPTVLRAQTTIFSHQDRLNTAAGLFNITAFRGVFYGSLWAQQDLRWFDHLRDWLDCYSTSNLPEAHFVNKRAYGSFMGTRSVAVLDSYWELSSSIDWEETIRQAQAGNIQVLFDQLLQFRNIGPLSALLIVGDLVECGLIPSPSIRIWARLITIVGRGAVSGLIALGLVKQGEVTEESVAAALTFLHEYISQTVPKAQLDRVRYDLIMLEHTLCKYSRALNERLIH